MIRVMTGEELPAARALIEKELAPYEVEVDLEWGCDEVYDYLTVKASVPFEELKEVYKKKWEPLVPRLQENFGNFFDRFESLCSLGCGRFGRVCDMFNDWSRLKRLKNQYTFQSICMCPECLREICEREKVERGEDMRACFRCGKMFKEYTGWETAGFLGIGSETDSKRKAHVEVKKADYKKIPVEHDEYCSEECALESIKDFLRKLKRNRYLKETVQEVFGGKK